MSFFLLFRLDFSDLDFKAYTPVPYSLRHNDDRVKNGQVFNVIIKMHPDFDRSFTHNFLNADIGNKLCFINYYNVKYIHLHPLS